MTKKWGKVGTIARVAGIVVAVVATEFTAQSAFWRTFAITNLNQMNGDRPYVGLGNQELPKGVKPTMLNEDEQNRQEKVECHRDAKLISLDPTDAEAYFNLGNTLYNQGKLAEAIAAYRKAISLNPNYAEAYTNLGVALGEQGKSAEAIAAHQKAISLNPNLAEAYYNLGVALRPRGKLVEVIAAFQKATSLNPNYAKAYYNLGIVLRQQGKLGEAIAAYQKARDLYRAQGNTQQADKITQVLEQLGSR